ncbi:hypothetical protein [Candidatus Pyrohabitans sp.]
MITEEIAKKLAEEFVENVYAETGILLSTDDISFEVSRDRITLKLWGCELLSTGYAEDVSEADLSFWLRSEDIADRIVQVRISVLEERFLPVVEQRVIEALIARGIAEEAIEQLVFSIEDLGYERRHWEDDIEAERGYPTLALRIEGDNPEVEFCYPLATDLEEPLDDFEDLLRRLCEDIRGTQNSS